jgi:hypothetical protein
VIRGNRKAGQALLLSLLAHSLVAVPLCFLRGPAIRTPLDTGIEDDDRELALSMAALPSVKAPSGEEEQQGAAMDFPVEIREAPHDSNPDTAGSTPPVIEPRTGPTSRSGASAAGRGGSLLAAPPSARRVVYVVDRSLSMGLNGALARARRELLAGIAGLAPATRFQVILYNRQAEPLHVDGQSGYLSADESTLATVTREVEHVLATGNTDHARALKAALRLEPDVLFLVTDADDLTDAQVREVTRLNNGRTAIHAIELSQHQESAGGPLRRLAEMNGGTYRRVPAAD